MIKSVSLFLLCLTILLTTRTESLTIPSSPRSNINSRRSFTKASIAAVVFSLTFLPSPSFAAEKDELLSQLRNGKELLSPLSDKLANQEWDAVRSVLKGPGLGELWNLGASKNTIGKLAKATDNMGLMELGDELQISLQMADQLTYDNAFVYFQPGNGKVDIKGPQNMISKAQKQLEEIIEMGAE